MCQPYESNDTTDRLPWDYGDGPLPVEPEEINPNMPSDEEWREEQQEIYDEHDPGQSYAEEARRAFEREY